MIRGGEYRQGNVALNRHSGLTIQPAPGETVWFTGSDPVTGWVADSTGIWVRNNWHSSLNNSAVDPKMINPAYPMAGSPDMVFFNGLPLRQMANKSQVHSGTFFVDRGAGRLYIGNNPTNVSVEASTRSDAITTSQVADTTIRGIGFHRYGTNVTQIAAVKATGTRDVLENDVFADNAAGGASVIKSVDSLVRNNTFERNGQVGLQGDHAVGPVVTGNNFSSNNSEYFTSITASGGLKFTTTTYATIRNNSAIDNHSHGIWLDAASNHAIYTGNYAQGNAGAQLYFEVSDDAVIANNVAVGGPVGIMASRSTNFDIWNNTVYKSDIGIKFQRGDAGGNGRIFNNVVATNPDNLAIAVQDVNHVLNGHQMGVSSNHNAYYRRYPSSSHTWGWWANWPLWELHADNMADYQHYSGDEMQSFSVENSPADPFIANPGGSNFVLPSGSPANNRGAALPSRVASVLGRPAGQIVDIGHLG